MKKQFCVLMTLSLLFSVSMLCASANMPGSTWKKWGLSADLFYLMPADELFNMRARIYTTTVNAVFEDENIENYYPSLRHKPGFKLAFAYQFSSWAVPTAVTARWFHYKHTFEESRLFSAIPTDDPGSRRVIELSSHSSSFHYLVSAVNLDAVSVLSKERFSHDVIDLNLGIASFPRFFIKRLALNVRYAHIRNNRFQLFSPDPVNAATTEPSSSNSLPVTDESNITLNGIGLGIEQTVFYPINARLNLESLLNVGFLESEIRLSSAENFSVTAPLIPVSVSAKNRELIPTVDFDIKLKYSKTVFHQGQLMQVSTWLGYWLSTYIGGYKRVYSDAGTNDAPAQAIDSKNNFTLQGPYLGVSLEF